MRVVLCGVRGSVPAPGLDFARVGGETSCVAIARDGEPVSLVLDAGTGIRRCSDLLDGEPFRGTVLLGHLHWDHTIGLPFFRAADRADAVVELLLPEQGVAAVDLLSRSMSPPHFPITPEGLRGRWTFGTYDEGDRVVAGFSVLAREIPHKGGRTMGLRVSDGRSTVAYLSDHAPQELGDGADALGPHHEAALTLARDADLLIHDAQYTAAELPSRRLFGHAAAEYAVTLAREAGARRVVLFHHDPARRDEEADALLAAARAGADGVVVELAIEGAEYRL